MAPRAHPHRDARRADVPPQLWVTDVRYGQDNAVGEIARRYWRAGGSEEGGAGAGPETLNLP